jgi:hypothetical protein
VKKLSLAITILLFATAAFADIAVTDRGSTARIISGNNAATHAAAVAANNAKRAAKHAKQHAHSRLVGQAFHLAPNATGSVALIDSGGLKYFINTNITFSTTSSASAGMSEASYTHAVNASTSAGGVTSSTLNDSYDGYNTLCVSLTNATGPCATGNAAYTIYNKLGPASVDATVPVSAACTGRQYVFPIQTVGGLHVQRKVFVPNNDRFARWMNIFTNTTGAPITFTMLTSNNLGSDSNTRVVTTSSGDNVATTSDLWVTSFQNFSGNTSSDPRLFHVLQGTGAPTPVSNINFVDGDDNPYWVYSITIPAGGTKVIVNFGGGMETKALAASQAAALANFPANAQQCMSATELSEVSNFAVNLGALPTMNPWVLALLGLSLAMVALVRRS